MKKSIWAVALCLLFSGKVASQNVKKNHPDSEKNKMEKINAHQYTTFKVDSNITVYKVTFKNQYNMVVAGHLFI